MTETNPTDVTHPTETAAQTGWHALPNEARSLFLLTHLLTTGIIALVQAGILIPVFIFVDMFLLLIPLAILISLPSWGFWTARLRWRHTQWMLDEHGLRVRKGRFWQSETLVPRARVQHLDIERGPLERRFGLATLVVHTAGTRVNALKQTGFTESQAQQLRDQLIPQGKEHDDIL